MDLAQWLNEIGFPQYVDLFNANNIDEEVLRSLSGEDLKDLGVGSLGHRKKLVAAIAALAAGPAAPPGNAERRQLTVMFCDLVGTTPLSSPALR